MNGQRTLRSVRLAFSLVASSGRRQLFLIVGTSVLTSAAIAGQLLIGRSLLDRLGHDRIVRAGELAPSLVTLGVLLLFAAITQSVAGELRIPLSERVYRRTMEDILDVATEVELEAYEGSEFHDRLQRARYAASGQSSAVVFGLVTLLSTLVVGIGVVGVLVSVAPILVPFAVFGYVPVFLVNIRNNRARYLLEMSQTELQRERSYLEFLMTERSEAKEVRAYELAPTLRSWHNDLWDVRMRGLNALVRRRLILASFGSLVATSVLVATLSLTLILAGRGTISLGDAAVAIVGLQQLSNRLQSAGTALNGVHEGVTFLRDFDTFRSSLPDIRQRRPIDVPPVRPSVLTVDRLGYRYPGAQSDALRDVSFELRAGQIMAIVGANGSGKTTLAKLVCDLIPPTTGSIRWDGVDMAGCDPSLVHAQIAPVFQDYGRYMLTIRKAIGLGDASRLGDESRIRRAATEVGLDELIDSLPNGLDTRLGKAFANGVDLSIGQWQRLAIARALFRDAPVVILDEPSASLDPRAESELFDLLHSFGRNRIVLFVSHRFATVRSADVVLVLDQGEVAEMGSHAQLMELRGLYHELFELQALRYGLER